MEHHADPAMRQGNNVDILQILLWEQGNNVDILQILQWEQGNNVDILPILPGAQQHNEHNVEIVQIFFRCLAML